MDFTEDAFLKDEKNTLNVKVDTEGKVNEKQNEENPEEKAEKRKRGLRGTLDISSFKSKQAFVTLHLPLPVIISLRAHFGIFSIITASLPREALCAAAIKPAAPPPIITVFPIKHLK